MPHPLVCACSALLALLPAATSAAEQATLPRRPNVVVIYTDDQARDEIGCYGGRAPTPRIDSLARDGVRCDRYYCNTAVCCASRYALLSGRYASRSARLLKHIPAGTPASIAWQSSIVGEDHTLPLTLQRAGYATGVVGKWHQDSESFRPKTMPPFASIEADAIRQLMGANYRAACDTVLASGFSWTGALYWSNIDDGGPRAWMPHWNQYHNPEWITAEARRFIADNRERPFFLYVSHTLPHSPRGVLSLINARTDETAAGPLREKPDSGMMARSAMLARVGTAGYPYPMSEKDKRIKRWQIGSDHAATAMWLDESVGAILDQLDSCGLAQDTLVIYSSDNGGPTAKFTAYEEGSRLPLIARWPKGLPAGRTSPELVSTIDLAPTIYAACGVTPAAQAVIDGIDLLPALRGQAPGQPALFLENACTRAVVDAEGWKYLAVRLPPEAKAKQEAGQQVSQWGRVLDGKDQQTFQAEKVYPHYFAPDQLYQVDRDPLEESNLAADPANAGRLAALRSHLLRISATLPHAFGEFTSGTPR